MRNNTFATAFKLHTLGFSVIPSGSGDKGKAPLVNWTEYQSQQPTEDDLQKWQQELRPQLWGIVTGAISGVVVLDADTPEARAKLESELGQQPHIITPRGGGHWYFQHPGYHVKTTVRIIPDVDIRADGGFVNIVGSRPDGEYQIQILPTLDTLLPWDKLPQRIQQALNGSKPATQKAAPVNETILNGERNATLTSLAGTMRQRGMPQTAIEAALLETNATLCQPPLPKDAVLTIARSVSRYEPANKSVALHFNLTDMGNAERFASQYLGQIKYCHERKSWLIWNSKVWKWDTGTKIATLAKKTIRKIYHEAGGEPDEGLRKQIADHAKRSESQSKIEAMLELAKSETNIPVEVDQLDANQWLLNVNNGTMDLRTGGLQPHNPTDLITELIPIDYDPAATSQAWDDFLERIFESNQGLITYVQRGLGYSITGDQSEQVFFFCFGGGFNGKSTLLNAVRGVLGNHSTEVLPTTFMMGKNRHGGPDEAMASLHNKRFVCSSELEDNQRLSVSLVKRMTGGESLRCERKFEHGFNFKPTHKLWLSGNHEPIITDTTNSIWFRLKKIPFTVEIPEDERVKGLAEKLTAKHGMAILTWLVQGCLDWQRYGLSEPETVSQAVAEYREQQDILHDFLTESCLVKSSEVVEQATLYKQYKDWTEENEANPIGKTTFGNRLKEKGIKPSRGTGNKATWQGIRLLTSEEKVNLVNSVNDFIKSLREEKITKKTFGENVNEVNPINFSKLKGELTHPDTATPPVANDNIPPYPTHPCPKCGGEWALSPDGRQYVCENAECGYLHPLDCSCCHSKSEVKE